MQARSLAMKTHETDAQCLHCRPSHISNGCNTETSVDSVERRFTTSNLKTNKLKYIKDRAVFNISFNTIFIKLL